MPRKTTNPNSLHAVAQVIEYLMKRLGYEGKDVLEASQKWAKLQQKSRRRRKAEKTQIDMLNEIEALVRKG